MCIHLLPLLTPSHFFLLCQTPFSLTMWANIFPISAPPFNVHRLQQQNHKASIHPHAPVRSPRPLLRTRKGARIKRRHHVR
ncbi:hypothetical protein DFJ58DRAFT_796333 [Suillus subalutaceus]|uniref:uncharacterized protein n=1 Tax=Suillus subalutaceus TaxID=48586 RepID=UPI001B8801F6|nr:uncharacterized protein DFJ58DRAFT_796333 [Suillus subalutaceus]KAG1848542.1 hypothetical protein DFJ58DRAFT_796333 [Suillus subalutaceus]